MPILASTITAEQLLEMADIGRCELVRGEVVPMAPAGFHHGVIAARIAHRISEHALTRALGTVVTAEAGFILSRDPDTVRVPDVAFVQ